jgi:NAD(P)-dependent dehydrogenase (short-subunit alcohol dehydrogenase family)
MDLGLKNKVAVVTGAGSQKGFGKEIALTLAREGCDVAVVDIDLAGAKQTAAEIEALGRKSLALKADVASSAEVNEAVKAALAKFKRIDVLVNNAGAISTPRNFVDKPEVEYTRDIDLNLKGTLHFSRAVLPGMLERKSGKIVSISSIGAKKGTTHAAAYNAAKAGIVGFTQTLAAEVSPSGINVNAIAPGLGLTNFGGPVKPPGFVENAIPRIPVRRTTQPSDIANTVAFLVSDVSSDITGQNIGVDGGESIV